MANSHSEIDSMLNVYTSSIIDASQELTPQKRHVKKRAVDDDDIQALAKKAKLSFASTVEKETQTSIDSFQRKLDNVLSVVKEQGETIAELRKTNKKQEETNKKQEETNKKLEESIQELRKSNKELKEDAYDSHMRLKELEQSDGESLNGYYFSSSSQSPSEVSELEGGNQLCYSNNRYSTEFDQILNLGHGSFGSVLKVKNKLDLKEYAVKRVSLGDSDLLLTDALAEVTIMAALPPHPNLIRYYGSWLECTPFAPCEDEEEGEEGVLSDMSSNSSISTVGGDALYIQMGLCGDGGTLTQLLMSKQGTKQGTRCFLSPQNIHIYKQLLSAVLHLHSHNIEHLDITPRNVFHSNGDVWCLGDFGFSAKFGEVITKEVGTDLYAAPVVSVVKGSIVTTGDDDVHAVSCGAADVYSLGVILVEMCMAFNSSMERGVVLGQIKSLVHNAVHDKSVFSSGLLPPELLQEYPELSSLVSDLSPLSSGRPTIAQTLARFIAASSPLSPSSSTTLCSITANTERIPEHQQQIETELDLRESVFIGGDDGRCVSNSGGEHLKSLPLRNLPTNTEDAPALE